jgi:UDP:flavonoid glycosyltransferase YjiC (YdhE family)
VPENVHVERWVPQGAVMPHAAAMVGHGGSGSTLMAMAAAMPLAVVPLFADQPVNAARVAELGAGLALDGVEDLATAVRSLLAVPSYRAAASAVADEIATHRPIEDVVALLRSIARGDALAA